MAQVFEAVSVDKDLTVLGQACLARRDTISEATAARTITSADYGKCILLSYAGAVAITLPANGAPVGSIVDFLVIGANTCAPTISAATADSLITVNDQAADSVTYATGHRVGA